MKKKMIKSGRFIKSGASNFGSNDDIFGYSFPLVTYIAENYMYDEETDSETEERDYDGDQWEYEDAMANAESLADEMGIPMYKDYSEPYLCYEPFMIEIEAGYYEGMWIKIREGTDETPYDENGEYQGNFNWRPFTDEQMNKFADKLNEYLDKLCSDYGWMKLGVSARFNNGETWYNKIENSRKAIEFSKKPWEGKKWDIYRPGVDEPYVTEDFDEMMRFKQDGFKVKLHKEESVKSSRKSKGKKSIKSQYTGTNVSVEYGPYGESKEFPFYDIKGETVEQIDETIGYYDEVGPKWGEDGESYMILESRADSEDKIAVIEDDYNEWVDAMNSEDYDKIIKNSRRPIKSSISSAKNRYGWDSNDGLPVIEWANSQWFAFIPDKKYFENECKKRGITTIKNLDEFVDLVKDMGGVYGDGEGHFYTFPETGTINNSRRPIKSSHKVKGKKSIKSGINDECIGESTDGTYSIYKNDVDKVFMFAENDYFTKEVYYDDDEVDGVLENWIEIYDVKIKPQYKNFVYSSCKVKGKKSITNDLKLITSFDEYKPWSGAVETYERVEEAGLLDTLESLLEDAYPEGIGRTELNDLFWFESDWIYEMLGMESEDDEITNSRRPIKSGKTTYDVSIRPWGGMTVERLKDLGFKDADSNSYDNVAFTYTTSEPSSVAYKKLRKIIEDDNELGSIVLFEEQIIKNSRKTIKSTITHENETMIEILENGHWEFVSLDNTPEGWSTRREGKIFPSEEKARSSALVKRLAQAGYSEENGNLKFSRYSN